MKNLSFIILLTIIFSCSSDDNNDEVLNCETPLNILISDITPNSALINWAEDDNKTNVEIEYGLSGFVVGSGTSINTNGNSHLLENLNPETDYDIYLKTICNNQESDISAAINLTTLCNNIYPGDLILSTQEEIDNFPKCFTKIGGNLVIGGTGPVSSDITSLAPLANINAIGGSLQIKSNDNLLSLFGLSNIATINTNPVPVGGLSGNIKSLEITFNEQLTNIDSLGNLTDMGIKIIQIGGNDNLISLNGLDTLFKNNSDCHFSIRIIGNEALTDLSFKSLNRLGFFIITDNNSLQSLKSFRNMTCNKGTLILTDNDMLNDFCGLQNLFNTGFDTIDMRNNLFNPSIQDIIDGNCRQ